MNIKFLVCWVFDGPAIIAFGFSNMNSEIWEKVVLFRVKEIKWSQLKYRMRAIIITRGLNTFYPLFEVHLFTVTFGLMYG